MKQKKIYERPTIVPHSVGLMNKFGRTSAYMPADSVDGVSAKELVEKYGSPLYVVSEGTLRRKYREMYRAFTLRYPKVVIAYSYKTNYLSGVCSILHKEGAWAEVVSGFEYEIALALNVPGDKIVFNGPYKRKEELERAIINNSKINIDSYEELNLIESIAREMNKVVNIGIRVNAEVNYPPWDRFGFNIESGQAFDVSKLAVSSPHVKLKGLHIHVGTYITDLHIYETMIIKLMAFCKRLNDELGVEVEYLDLGGGYASMNSLHGHWLPPEQICPTFDQYAEIICPAILRGPFKPQHMPTMFLEPGRSIVDESMHILTTIVSTKKLTNGSKGIVIDAGVNLLPTCYWYKFNFSSMSGYSYMPSETVDIYGPMCMQIDVLRYGVSLPSPKKGDLLIVKNIGAYNFSQSMQFIQPRPAVVLINEGKTEYLRLPENTEYIRQMERIPEHLKS